MKTNTAGNRATLISVRADRVINLMFLLYSAACIIPILMVVSVSFTDEQSIILHGYGIWPETFSTYAYAYIFGDSAQVLRSYGISIFVTVVGTLLSVLLMALYAFPISRPDFPHKTLFSYYVFIPMLFNGGLVPFYLIYTNVLQLKNSVWALILPLVVNTFFILMIRTFFASTIPQAVLESAKMDGASEFQLFRKIVLPLSLPVLATVALFSTLNYWNDWFHSLIFITDNKNVSLQYLMYRTMLNVQYLASNSQAAERVGTSVITPSESMRMAMCVIGMGPIVLAYPFFQRYFVKGLTVGAVKG